MEIQIGRFEFIAGKWKLPTSGLHFSFYGRYGIDLTVANLFEFFLMWDFNNKKKESGMVRHSPERP